MSSPEQCDHACDRSGEGVRISHSRLRARGRPRDAGRWAVSTRGRAWRPLTGAAASAWRPRGAAAGRC